MNGSPLLRFFPALAGVCLVGALLYHLTSTPGAEYVAPRTQTSQTAESAMHQIPALLIIKCAHAPHRITVNHGKNILWQSDAPALQDEAEVLIPAADSLTLSVTAVWPQGTPNTPITLELEPEGKPNATATRWSFGPEINDTFTFSWK